MRSLRDVKGLNIAKFQEVEANRRLYSLVSSLSSFFHTVSDEKQEGKPRFEAIRGRD